MTTFVPENLFDVVPGAIDVDARGPEAIVGAMQMDDLKGVSEEYAK
jgi:hypothetical protein